MAELTEDAARAVPVGVFPNGRVPRVLDRVRATILGHAAAQKVQVFKRGSKLCAGFRAFNRVQGFMVGLELGDLPPHGQLPGAATHSACEPVGVCVWGLCVSPIVRRGSFHARGVFTHLNSSLIAQLAPEHSFPRRGYSVLAERVCVVPCS